jgi:hypothetical protein
MEKITFEYKRRNEIISVLDKEEDLINFYENQKKTFGSKKISPR